MSRCLVVSFRFSSSWLIGSCETLENAVCIFAPLVAELLRIFRRTTAVCVVFFVFADPGIAEPDRVDDRYTQENKPPFSTPPFTHPCPSFSHAAVCAEHHTPTLCPTLTSLSSTVSHLASPKDRHRSLPRTRGKHVRSHPPFYSFIKAEKSMPTESSPP